MLAIKYLPIDDLIPYSGNARTHSDDQVKEIVKSIKKHGWTNPILLDGNKGIIAGHGRLLAARKLNLNEVPTIDLSFASDAQKAEYIIADNKLALNAGWDFDLLKDEFDILAEAGIDITDTGFSQDEIDAIMNPEVLNDGLCDDDEIPDIAPEPVTKLGDIYMLGNHRLMCGDSTMIDSVEKLMNGKKADMAFTDPPYGISIVSRNKKIGGDKSFGSGGGKIVKSNLYAPVIGDDSIQTAIDSYNLCLSMNIPVLIFWGGNYYASSLPDSSCWIVWDKDNTGNFADAELAWTNQKTAVRIFKHTWNGLIKESERGEKRVHPTQKPVALAEWCLNEYGDNHKAFQYAVLDLFGGSGSTLIACEKTNRKCYMMEISPHYCDVIIKRWQKFTGKQAILESTQQTFDEVANAS